MQTQTDAELLDAYATRHDDVAFAELMRRHSSLVYRACYRLLRDGHEAEDASQAVFLVLARKAGGLRRDDLAAWLYRVAHHVGAETVRKRMRRTQREAVYAENRGTQAEDFPAAATDQAAVLRLVDVALLSLPEHYRQAVILRYLQNHSEQEAARRVGCPLGTLSRRASEGLARLRRRLGELGVATSATTLTGLLAAEASAAAPETLLPGVLATLQSGAVPAAGAATALRLAQGVLRTLFWAKVKTVAAAVLLTAGIAGVGFAASQRAAAPPPATAGAAAAEPRSPADAWLRELLVRAEAGAWDTVDFAQGTTWGASDDWRHAPGTGAADRRLWQIAPTPVGMALFDAARWQRGVVVGRVLILPAGELPTALAPPAAAAKAPWPGGGGGLDPNPAGQHSVGLVLYEGDRAAAAGDPLLVCATLAANRRTRGVWYRYAAYFDTTTAGKAVVLSAVWPAADAEPPPAAAWKGTPKDCRLSAAVGLGLTTRQAAALWQGVKLVPLGPELPPPAGLPFGAPRATAN